MNALPTKIGSICRPVRREFAATAGLAANDAFRRRSQHNRISRAEPPRRLNRYTLNSKGGLRRCKTHLPVWQRFATVRFSQFPSDASRENSRENFPTPIAFRRSRIPGCNGMNDRSCRTSRGIVASFGQAREVLHRGASPRWDPSIFQTASTFPASERIVKILDRGVDSSPVLQASCSTGRVLGVFPAPRGLRRKESRTSDVGRFSPKVIRSRLPKSRAMGCRKAPSS